MCSLLRDSGGESHATACTNLQAPKPGKRERGWEKPSSFTFQLEQNYASDLILRNDQMVLAEAFQTHRR